MTSHLQTTPHRNTAIKLYAAPLAMLVIAGALAPPTATADQSPLTHRTVQAAFHYDADAPAEQIYAKLRTLVDRMCTTRGPRSLAVRRSDEACITSAMKDGVSRIGRTDIAALHGARAG